MPRLLGVNIPEEKRVEIALTSIYGIGRKNVQLIIKRANIDIDKRAKDLTNEEIARLQKAVETVPVEGMLRKVITENIKRLQQIKSYRGLRHLSNLPVRGQRTRTNARVKRGKRMTIGALKKDAMQKVQVASKEKEKSEKKS